MDSTNSWLRRATYWRGYSESQPLFSPLQKGVTRTLSTPEPVAHGQPTKIQPLFVRCVVSTRAILIALEEKEGVYHECANSKNARELTAKTCSSTHRKSILRSQTRNRKCRNSVLLKILVSFQASPMSATDVGANENEVECHYRVSQCWGIGVESSHVGKKDSKHSHAPLLKFSVHLAERKHPTMHAT